MKNMPVYFYNFKNKFILKKKKTKTTNNQTKNQRNPFLPATANQMFNFVLDHLNRNIPVYFINSEEFVLGHFCVKLNLPVLLQGSSISDAFS